MYETKGIYWCFGCSESSENPALSIIPNFDMKLVKETEERYCNDEFTVITANIDYESINICYKKRSK